MTILPVRFWCRFVGPISIIVGILLTTLCPISHATPGRSWGPHTRLVLPDHAYMPVPRLASDPDGNVRLTVVVHDASADSAFGLAWADDQWAVRWRVGRKIYPGQVVSAAGESCHLWLDFATVPGDVFGTLGRLLLACAPGDDPPAADSVTTTDVLTNDFAALIGSRLRWVVVDAPIYGVPGDELRLYRSPAAGHWSRIPAVGRGRYGVTAGELTDTSALILWSNETDGLRWGVADEAGLVEKGDLPGFSVSPLPPSEPHLRPRPSGGFWLSWGRSDTGAGIAAYVSGIWGPAGRLACAYSHPLDQHFVWQTAMSQDAGEYPAVAWAAQVSGDVATMCALIPSDTGFTEAVDLGYTREGLDPTVARDRNGDVWVAWWSYSGGTYWTHSYTSATSSAPRLSGAGRARTLAWTLSEPAPETWWAVLRAVNGGAFESVARVRAGPSLEMSWTDTPPVANLLAYKIRRECLDARYGWESTAITVGAGARSPIYLGPPTGAPGGGGIEPPEPLAEQRWNRLQLSMSGAEAGLLAVRVYDLQGRAVLERTGWTRGGGEPFEFDLAEARRTLAAAIYFLRVSDATGRASNAVRFVILK